MELKLNIYNELDEVVKTYTRDGYSIKMGLLKRIITIIDLDALAKCLKAKTNESNASLISLVYDLALNSYDTVLDLMKDVFKGLTEEEYNTVHLDEVIDTIINLGKYTFSTIGIAGKDRKN